jgi:hypothetical protein
MVPAHELRALQGNSRTEWGNENEPRALAAYTLLTGREVELVDFVVRACTRHLRRWRWRGTHAAADALACPQVARPDAPGAAPWLGASPDGLLHDGAGLVEIKCPTARVRACQAPQNRAEAPRGACRLAPRGR